MGGMEGGSTCLWVGVAGSDTSLPLRRMEGRGGGGGVDSLPGGNILAEPTEAVNQLNNTGSDPLRQEPVLNSKTPQPQMIVT